MKIKKILRFTIILIAIPIVYVLGVLVYATVTDYQPLREINLKINPPSTQNISTDTLTCLIWNIGYGGLGEEMDFFYDGGKQVRASKKLTDNYLKGINAFIKQHNTVDFVLLQEVDSASKRTYYINQIDLINKSLPDFENAFALNYNVNFVPLPFALNYKPYGQAKAGLLSLSKYNQTAVKRFQYPGGFAWPESVFMLDRCFLEQAFLLPNGKNLYIINTHNTAYDATGLIKKEEMLFLKTHVDSLYNAGNYVLIGGDFNQSPPGVDVLKFSTNLPSGYTRASLDLNVLPKNFKLGVDTTQPTNRSLNKVYASDKTVYKSIIDFFLLSPNLEIIKIETLKQDFKNSDHEPVLIKFCIKK